MAHTLVFLMPKEHKGWRICYTLGVIASFWAFLTDDGLRVARRAGSGHSVIGVIVRASSASFWRRKSDDALQPACSARSAHSVIGVILVPMTPSSPHVSCGVLESLD